MVRGVVVGGEAVWADLLLCGNVQQALNTQSIMGIPDIVQSAAALSGGADLPRGIGWLCLPITAKQLVCGVQAKSGGAEAPVNIF